MIELSNITVQAGSFRLQDASLSVPEGQYGVLMGKTGSGKSTLLEAIAGLKRVSAGRIRLGNTDVTDLKPALRGIGYVPQDGAMFSTMTVAEHLSFALDVRRAPRHEREARVAELSELLGIRDLLERYPLNLSGGERQRVSLGRALSFRPHTLLLDEPLSAIDDDTREDMYALLKSVQSITGVTSLHVTHSHDEAERLADCVFVLKQGRIESVQ